MFPKNEFDISFIKITQLNYATNRRQPSSHPFSCIVTIIWVIKRLCPPLVPEARRQELKLVEIAKLTQRSKKFVSIGAVEEETLPSSTSTSSSSSILDVESR